MSARRAVVRWAVRLFRRDWRQQVLVLALLSVAVAGTVAGASAAFNMASSSEATFGSANVRLRFPGSSSEERVAGARQSFGTIETIGHRYERVRGSVEDVELRAQDPHGPFGGPMLRLLSGRYPAAPGEVAVTDRALVGPQWTVVGRVENPADLADEFALVSPAHAGPPSLVTVLAVATAERLDAYRAAFGTPPVLESRGTDGQVLAAAGVFGFAAVGLLLVCLVAAAGFAVVAGRRLRQLGMLAAIGATERHLRLVLLANGAVVGLVAAVLGTGVGLGVWLTVAPWMETVAGHRVGRFDVPWWLIVPGMLLAVVTATAAAWWPARAVTRVPIVQALSARPPRPRPARRSAIAAVVFLAAGIGCLALGDQKRILLIVAGTVATALGVLFMSPLAIRALAVSGGRAPVGVRLALRDLGRFQARSGAALAAISLSLAIPIAVVITAAAAQYTASEGNLSDNVLLVRRGDQPSVVPADAAVDLPSRLVERLDRPVVVELEAATDPRAPVEPGSSGGPGGRPVVELGWPSGEGRTSTNPLYVATPELLSYYGLAGTAGSADVLSRLSGDRFEFVNITARGVAAAVVPVNISGYTSMPSSLVTPDAVRRHRWDTVRAGWLVQSASPLTSAQLAAAREAAADAGLTIEARRDQSSLVALGWGATAAGGLLALGVLAITVGLIRGEAAGDLRTLTAAGASRRVRRTLTATTAGALALLGALLGTIGAYVGLLAGYLGDIGALSRVPVPQLTVTAVGLPLVAALAGWLLAGREPSSMARQPLS